MFTGIVEYVGSVDKVVPDGDGIRITVHIPRDWSDLKHGDSIAVSGVCLTATDLGTGWFSADVMKQSLAMTCIGNLASGTAVNLERAMSANGRLGGHIVQGHVDGTGTILQVRPGAQWRVLRIGIPTALAPLVADKGSIAVDGVSLTVSAVSEAQSAQPWFEVSFIPETLTATILGQRQIGDAVNVETDILARHVQRLMMYSMDR